MALLFKKLGDSVKGLLDNDYPNTNNNGPDLGLDSSIKLSSGDVTVKVSGHKNPDGETGASVDPEIKFPEKNATLSGSFTTENKFGVKLAVSDVGTDGLTLTLGGSADSKAYNASGNLEYKHAQATLVATVDQKIAIEEKDENSTDLYLALNIQPQDGFSVGADAKYNLAEAFSAVNGKIQYEGEGFNLNLFSSNKLGKDNKLRAGVSYFHEVNESVESALDVTVDPVDLLAIPTVRLGVSNKCKNKGTSFKGKFTFAGIDNLRLATVYKQKISDDVDISFGADLNVKQIVSESNGDAHRFGLSLSFFD
eukprot:TRINITY_DN12093_c0_g1_i1.p1 TRINITY_DN12093_c0_g1~~TRINITY_DN12093_c0_g1_i1.p1  ORF type:complete len:309 (+),score=79.42 TRINITY_DN12093_c0_g1_i1:60-986(+)